MTRTAALTSGPFAPSHQGAERLHTGLRNARDWVGALVQAVIQSRERRAESLVRAHLGRMAPSDPGILADR